MATTTKTAGVSVVRVVGVEESKVVWAVKRVSAPGLEGFSAKDGYTYLRLFQTDCWLGLIDSLGPFPTVSQLLHFDGMLELEQMLDLVFMPLGPGKCAVVRSDGQRDVDVVLAELAYIASRPDCVVGGAPAVTYASAVRGAVGTYVAPVQDLEFPAGYCYLRLFEPAVRVMVRELCGPYPTWCDVLAQTGWLPPEQINRLSVVWNVSYWHIGRLPEVGHVGLRGLAKVVIAAPLARIGALDPRAKLVARAHTDYKPPNLVGSDRLDEKGYVRATTATLLSCSDKLLDPHKFPLQIWAKRGQAVSMAYVLRSFVTSVPDSYFSSGMVADKYRKRLVSSTDVTSLNVRVPDWREAVVPSQYSGWAVEPEHVVQAVHSLVHARTTALIMYSMRPMLCGKTGYHGYGYVTLECVSITPSRPQWTFELHGTVPGKHAMVTLPPGVCVYGVHSGPMPLSVIVGDSFSLSVTCGLDGVESSDCYSGVQVPPVAFISPVPLDWLEDMRSSHMRYLATTCRTLVTDNISRVVDAVEVDACVVELHDRLEDCNSMGVVRVEAKVVPGCTRLRVKLSDWFAYARLHSFLAGAGAVLAVGAVVLRSAEDEEIGLRRDAFEDVVVYADEAADISFRLTYVIDDYAYDCENSDCEFDDGFTLAFN